MNVDTDRKGIRRRLALDDAARGGLDLQVVAPEMYDSARAKIAANLSWLFSKAFGTDDVPPDFQDPFYTDQYEQEHIKPPIIHLLLSSELYCIVCGLLLQPEHASSLQSHTSVLQALSRKGIFVLDDNNRLISEMDLSSAPIRMSSHIHLIDALMMADIEEMISIEKVMSAVRCFSEISDSTEVPLDLEAAVVFWINKVHSHKDHLSGRSHQHFYFLDDLSDFVCNATALLTVIHFYCPELIRLEDICLKETPSTPDIMYNIELLRDFSDEFLNKCFHLTPEDVLYSPPVLKCNMTQYIAELFWTFEIVKPDFMLPRDISEINDVRGLRQQQRPHTPKHKFWTLNSSNTFAGAPSPDICFRRNSNSSMPPLCRKEHQVIKDHTLVQRNWSTSVTQPSEQQSTFPWSRNRQRCRSLSQIAPNVPMKEDATSISFSRSLSKDSFMSTTPKHTFVSGHPRRLSGQRLLNHIRFEDEEEEIEEEELVAIIDPSTLPRRRHQSDLDQRDFRSASRVSNSRSSSRLDSCPFLTEPSVDKYYLEPLMPAIHKPAKEKSVNVKKEEECGESASKGAVRKITRSGSGALHTAAPQSDSKYTSKASATSTSHQDRSKHSYGFYLHLLEGPKGDSSVSSLEASNDSDSDVEDLTDNENELNLMGNRVRFQERCYRIEQGNVGEGESAKLGEDLKANEWDDKEDHSGCSSPSLSSVSGSGSFNAPKMTSFAEKRRLKLGRDGLSSAGSTPDSEASPCPPWQMKKSGSCYSLDKEPRNVAVPSEFLELHMELEERRHAIECQKKKMETLSAQQRLKLGKAAFLNVVKKEPGRSDTLPLPSKHEPSVLRAAGKSKMKIQSCKDDSCLEALKMKAIQSDETQLIRDNKLSQDSGQNSNVSSRSIEVLNEAIATIQQQLLQLSQQQDILIKHSSAVPSKPESEANTTSTPNPSAESAGILNFISIDDSSPVSRKPKLSSSQPKASRRKEVFFEIFDNKDSGKVKRDDAEMCKTEQEKVGSDTFGDRKVINQQCTKDKTGPSPITSEAPVDPSSTAAEKEPHGELETVDSRAKAFDIPDKSTRMKAQLIEVDLSEMKEPSEQSGADAENEQKNTLGFFFKDEERADEMAKRRAAFLIKQQRKAEEAKIRKQQLEAESELKRDEARRKAEEERIRKEEEKARREFIKQEYLRRKQQMLIEEQGLVKSLPRTRSRKSRPKSLHRETPSNLFRGATTPEPSNSRRGSTLSLATEADSIISVDSHCAESVCSMDSFPVLSRTSSRNMERDWENASIASSITSTEYTGPKLFKEPSSKSNKPIIINAIAHCCLAGKVNETQKNVILEELDKCESNHLIILFRDGGCQFRAIYSFSPDTEEITKVTGTGPRSISHKMIDKLYKYSSDRKQFSVIPAKSVSVSIDALTIHNHLWHVKRPGSARRK